MAPAPYSSPLLDDLTMLPRGVEADIRESFLSNLQLIPAGRQVYGIAIHVFSD